MELNRWWWILLFFDQFISFSGGRGCTWLPNLICCFMLLPDTLERVTNGSNPPQKMLNVINVREIARGRPETTWGCWQQRYQTGGSDQFATFCYNHIHRSISSIHQRPNHLLLLLVPVQLGQSAPAKCPTVRQQQCKQHTHKHTGQRALGFDQHFDQFFRSVSILFFFIATHPPKM